MKRNIHKQSKKVKTINRKLKLLGGQHDVIGEGLQLHDRRLLTYKVSTGREENTM